MKRRNFLKSSALGLVSASCLSNINEIKAITHPFAASFAAGAMGEGDGLNPIVPFLYYPEKEEFMLKQLLEMKEKYGISRFVFIGPYPDKAEDYDLTAYRELGKQIKNVKEKLAGHNIDIGWWGVGLRYNMELGKGFQRIVNIDGTVTMRSYCPLDKRFQQFMSGNIVELVNLAHPFVVQFDDDYELSWQPPGNNNFGCFCPLHLKMFGERMGRYYSREELVSVFSKVTPESKRLRRAWAELSRDSLAELAAAVRREVDKVAPETRLSLCQAGCSDFDGDFTEAVTKAFAGETRPMVRLYGTEYSSHQDMGIPSTIFHALYSRQHLPENFECFYEADTAPHLRFFMSASKLKTLITLALSYGLENILLYAAQYNDTPLEERGYFEMYRSEQKRFSALKEAVKECEVTGCQVVHNPFSHIANPYNGRGAGVLTNEWSNVLGRMGIPYSARKEKVKMLSGFISDSLSDAEIKEMLSGGLVLDGQAAFALYKSGFGDLIGLQNIEPMDTSSDVSYGTEVKSNYILTPSEEVHIRKKYSISSFNVMNTEDDIKDGKSILHPDLYMFENREGGRIVVFSLSVAGNRSSLVYNYKIKEIYRQTIEWAGEEKLPVYVNNIPNAFCVFNRERAGDYGVVTVISICSDIFDSFELDLAKEWQNATIEQLDENGRWNSADIAKNEKGITVNQPLSYLTPVILKLTKG